MLELQKNQKFEFLQLESAGIKFNDLRGTGVSLRSQRMKLPANVGQKKTKALEQALIEFKVGKKKLTKQKELKYSPGFPYETLPFLCFMRHMLTGCISLNC